tara:strand:+ start:873 stop:2096 length:1224 start_codon:yes stop_codon:yes gene_type:complete
MKTTLLLFFTFISFGLSAQTTHNLGWANDGSSNNQSITIEQGDIIIWTWGSGTHNLRATSGTESFDSGYFTGSGNTFTHIFNQVGSTDYVCDPHASNMNGTVTVTSTAGCLDENASNYDATATEQSFDDYGNPACIYASCDDIPDAEGCIYANAYASYVEGFGPAECTLYGGTACTVAAIGCMDANASNYDSAATEQSFDQYGNSTCIYASCDDIPEYGCIYADGFGAFNANFNAANCVQYGGTPCEAPSTAGCLDENASNYDATATEQAFDQYGNFVCIYASCDDVPEYGCIYSDGFGAFSSDGTFTGAQCIEYGGTPCEEPAGCTDPLFVEFDPSVTLDDGSCSELVVEGCAYADADNYDVSANTDDGSCLFTLGSTCPGDFSGDGFVNVSDLGGFLGAFGEACD